MGLVGSANLTTAELDRADLERANLAGANLAGASLWNGPDLRFANLMRTVTYQHGGAFIALQDL